MRQISVKATCVHEELQILVVNGQLEQSITVTDENGKVRFSTGGFIR
jgi:hypothetical protein